ncbi:hypothetical protein M378DRAFT_530862 [Amanita muscaria Koide BX008]|uniref:Uncharacterized protein n=1 Tax=Amanita muscaria (strain Koide BX008) TaxID=946122 RepID=A0A0C2SQI5_AMAMK|nr:hypothetical protein M378DRAFT_530862 [Amanita muscaria Koide BX008]
MRRHGSHVSNSLKTTLNNNVAEGVAGTQLICEGRGLLRHGVRPISSHSADRLSLQQVREDLPTSSQQLL